ncbi:MAG TPA: DUF5343 domain-containing protein [Candidatus Paceibacterota bacterium]|jgi:hypothetical protein|nr:DUF5343 domain-containing protein [Candidatus Paceibacterota bacterium]
MKNKKSIKTKSLRTKKESITSEPKFPYTLTPASLRKLLDLIPNSPKPTKVNKDTLKAWGFMNSNDSYNIRVLKAVGMIDSSNAPTQLYIDFMSPVSGPAALGKEIRKVYSKLFETSNDPANASNEDLKRFFNVHSGGAEETLRLQMETFKALASYATFGASDALENPSAGGTAGSNGSGQVSSQKLPQNGPAINIDLHIHLPENKTKAEYEAIIDRIGEAIYKTNL